MFLEMLTAALIIATLSLVGVLFFGTSEKFESIHRFVLPAAVGVFLGVVFFELIPETLEASHEWGPATIILGFLGFYALSHFLSSFHHHHQEHDACVRDGGRMLLLGDTIHNIADGVVIASAFMINPVIGGLTTIGIALHEIPQEIAEFSVLLRSGYTKRKAAFYNTLSAFAVVGGVIITYFFAGFFSEYVFLLTGIAAGNLLYISTTDLIPELLESHRDHFMKSFLITLLGVIAIAGLITYTHEYLLENNFIEVVEDIA